MTHARLHERAVHLCQILDLQLRYSRVLSRDSARIDIWVKSGDFERHYACRELLDEEPPASLEGDPPETDSGPSDTDPSVRSTDGSEVEPIDTSDNQIDEFDVDAGSTEEVLPEEEESFLALLRQLHIQKKQVRRRPGVCPGTSIGGPARERPYPLAGAENGPRPRVLPRILRKLSPLRGGPTPWPAPRPWGGTPSNHEKP